MTYGQPWKLYEAREGHPRQLLGAYDTLTQAVHAFRDLTGSHIDTMNFSVTVKLKPGKGAPTARFVNDVRKVPYVIELAE